MIKLFNDLSGHLLHRQKNTKEARGRKSKRKWRSFESSDTHTCTHAKTWLRRVLIKKTRLTTMKDRSKAFAKLTKSSIAKRQFGREGDGKKSRDESKPEKS